MNVVKESPGFLEAVFGIIGISIVGTILIFLFAGMILLCNWWLKTITKSL